MKPLWKLGSSPATFTKGSLYKIYLCLPLDLWLVLKFKVWFVNSFELYGWLISRLPLGYGVCSLKHGSISVYYKYISQGEVAKLIGFYNLSEVNKKKGKGFN